ncbi:hypothetical protein Tco_0139851 [Tanacetum coccineum]
MHNNIMAAGSKERPPMLGPGRYSQWRSRFLRYIDTKPNGEGLRKSILFGPYVPSTVLVQAVAATEGVPAVQQHTTIETVLNMTPENKEHFLSEKEAIFLLLTGIGDDIYSTVDACKTANEMWIAIERLQQGESLNVQDVKTNLFWEFGKFTSRDGESMESYYSRPIQSTRHKGKITKQLHLQSICTKNNNDPEQAQRDKDMQKNLALLAKYFKRLYKPTNNNLRTSSNSRNKTEDTTPRRSQSNVKDYSYHKEKMMMCKQAEQGVPLQAEQADWLADTDEEIDEQELEAHYSFMAKIQEVLPEESSSTKQPLEQENKTILKQLKKANASLTQELEECKTNLVRLVGLWGGTIVGDSCLIALQNKKIELEKFAPNREETMTLSNESRSKLNKDYVKPYDYTRHNSLYEIFKAPSLEYLYQLERAKEVRKTMWRKPFVRTKPNIAKNVAFLPVSKSISKSRQVFNDMTFKTTSF